MADSMAAQCAITEVENDGRIQVTSNPFADGLHAYSITLPPEISNRPLIEVNLWVSSEADGRDENLVVPIRFQEESGVVHASFKAKRGWQYSGVVAAYGHGIDPCEWTFVGIDLDTDKSG